jgi:hypothetical protein
MIQILKQINKIKFLLFFISIFPINIFCMESQRGPIRFIICMDAIKAEKFARDLFDLANNLNNVFFAEKKLEHYQAQASLDFDPMNVYLHVDKPGAKGLFDAYALNSTQYLVLVSEDGNKLHNLLDEIIKIKKGKIVLLVDQDWYPTAVSAINSNQVPANGIYSVILLNPKGASLNFDGRKIEHRFYNLYTSKGKTAFVVVDYDSTKSKLVDYEEQAPSILLDKIPEVIFNADKDYKIIKEPSEEKTEIDFISGLVKACANLKEYNTKQLIKDNFTKACGKLKPVVPASVLTKLINQFYEKIKKDDLKGDLGKNEFYVQKKFVPSGSKICVVGDIHGSVQSLLRILIDLNSNKKLLNDDFTINGKKTYIVFTGDYADRGVYGAEVWYTILKLKLQNWDKVFLLRGNHEVAKQAGLDGFFLFPNVGVTFGELSSKYKQDFKSLRADFTKTFNYLSIALYIGSPEGDKINWIQFCHGGFPLGEKIEIDEKQYETALQVSEKNSFKNWQQTFLSKKDENFTKISSSSEATSFNWADFYCNGAEVYTSNSRTKGAYNPFYISANSDFFIIPDEVDLSSMFNDYGIKAIFRGHQHFFFGLKMFKKYQPVIAKPFGSEYDNMLKPNPAENPLDWRKVVAQNEQAEFPIYKYIPVFTFSTATEWGICPENFYAMLTTADDYKKWTLKPVVLPLKPLSAVYSSKATSSSSTD